MAHSTLRVAACVLVVCACNAAASSSSASDKPTAANATDLGAFRRVDGPECRHIVPGNKNSEFWDGSIAGAAAACQRSGCRLLNRAMTDAEASCVRGKLDAWSIHWAYLDPEHCMAINGFGYPTWSSKGCDERMGDFLCFCDALVPTTTTTTTTAPATTTTTTTPAPSTSACPDYPLRTGVCTKGWQCSSKRCKGGFCCTKRLPGCSSCDERGQCAKCSRAYTLVNGRCVRPE